MFAIDHQTEGFRFQKLKIELLPEALLDEATDHHVKLVLFKHAQQVITGVLHHLDR